MFCGTVIKPDGSRCMEKYPALAAILRYAAEHGVREPLHRLAVVIDRESKVLALYDLVRYAGTNDFVPRGLEREVNAVLDNDDFGELQRIAQSLVFNK